MTIGGLAATLVEAVAIQETDGVPVGTTSRFVYIIDYGAAGTMTIRTTGIADDPAYETNRSVATLMAVASTFTPPG